MPSPYSVKPREIPDGTIFHVISRGVDKMPIFRTPVDHAEFLECFRRYLCRERRTDRFRRVYRKLHDQSSVLAFGLMNNHFHMVVEQKSADGLRALAQSALIGYGRYFNDRHRRVGPVFQGRYKARPAESTFDRRYVIAYVHLNDPIRQLDHPWTTHQLYTGEQCSDWLDRERGLALFGGIDGYVEFMDRHGPAIVQRKLEKLEMFDRTLGYRPIGQLSRFGR